MNIFRIFFLLIFICKISFANNKIDSLKTVIKNSKEDSTKVKAQNILTWEYIYLSDFTSAKAIAEQAVILAKKINNKEGEARALNNIGVTHYYKSEYPQTLEYYFKALKIYVEINDLKGISRAKKNIALVYMDQNEYQKAEDIIVESIKYNEEIKDTNSLAGSFTLYALIKSKDKKTEEEAIAYYNKALQLYKQTGNQYDYAACLDNLGNVYYNSGNFKKALELYNQSYPLYIEANYLPDAVNSISNIGSVYMVTGDFPKAEKMITRGLIMADSLQLIYLASQNHLNLSEMYLRWNKPSKALEHYKKHIILRDSIYNEENTKKLVRSEMNFDFEKKEALQKVEQEKKDLLAKEEKQQQQIVIALVSAVLLLVLIFSVLLFKRFKITQKQKEIIEKQKQETEQQNEVIKKALAEREVLLREIHHRVKNNLQIVSSLLNLQYGYATNKSAEEILKVSESRIQSMALIHEKLYKNDNLKEIDFRDYVQNFIENIKQSYSSDIDFFVELENVKLDIDQLVPCGLILHELILNSIKHGFDGITNQNKKISIIAKANNSKIEIEVFDNGNGLLADFSFTKYKSLGIRLIKGLVAQLKGDISFDLNFKGAYFKFCFNFVMIK